MIIGESNLLFNIMRFVLTDPSERRHWCVTPSSLSPDQTPNGMAVAQGSQFSLNDVEVVTATVDLEEVRSYRAAISRGLQAATSPAKYQRIQTSFELSSEEDDADVGKAPTLPIQPRFHSVEEEIALCGGCYLWDVSELFAVQL